MADEIIGMDDMMAIYEVTDRFGIDRESISVPLERHGSGSVTGRPGGSVEITAPSTMDTQDWLTILQAVASVEFRDFLNHVVQGLRHYAPQGIIAEGIESDEELAIAEQMGIHLVQGHLFGEPGPIDLNKRGSTDRISRRVGGPPLHPGGRHDHLSGDPGTPPH